MNNIVLITTDGCQACKIQENIIQKAISSYKDKYVINFQKDDFNDAKIIVEQLNISDFPTTILIKDELYKYHFSGTCTKENLMHLFDEFFIENV